MSDGGHVTPSQSQVGAPPNPDDEASDAMSPAQLLAQLGRRWKLLTAGPLAVGLLALGVAFLIPPTFTARVSFVPPQASQGGSIAAALASLGPLANLAGGGAGVRSQGDLYVALLQSVTVSERLIDEFKLMEAYDVDLRVDARRQLAKNTAVTLGKKDGLITVDVEDRNAQRAADIANRYIDELRRLTSTLAVSEAQQRRAFFEQQLRQTHERLIKAQDALQASGISAGSLKTEPKVAAEGYARLKAGVTATEVRIQALRGALTDSAPEVRLQMEALDAMRRQLARLEQATDTKGAPDYVGRYRDYKYQEALFEVYARQFELARVDESREGVPIQVVDTATPPERKTRPKRALIAIGATVAAELALCAWVLLRRRHAA
jgi:uncharacterized protein involved in exopolysaccharide biosynthesis